MIDPEVHSIIADAAYSFVGDEDTANDAANAIIGALATKGFAFVKLDPGVVRRVLTEMHKDTDRA